MSQLQRLLDQLQDTDQAVARFEKLAAESHDEEALGVNIDAIRKRRADLERRLDAELRTAQADLVQYHIHREEVDRFPAAAVGKAMQGFQELVTAVFDAIRSVPKQRYRPSPESVELSTLDLAMVSPVGSVLVSMSVENERLIALESDLDATFKRVSQILTTSEPDMLRDLVAEVGIASISKAHDWAANAAQFGFDTRVEILKVPGASPMRFSVSRVQALNLKELIEEKSDQHIEPVDLIGELVGIDVQRPNTYFHLRTPDGTDIRGKLADTFRLDQEWSVRVSYSAQLIRVTTIKYATGEEEVDWVLAQLHEVDQT
jgi:hypothetical protein